MIIKSLLDNDFYKFTMMQAWWKLGMGETIAEYKFVDRNQTSYTKEQFLEIKSEIQNLEKLTFKEEELEYLKSLSAMDENFVEEELRNFKPQPSKFAVFNYDEKTGNIDIRFKGPLNQVSMFEIYSMAIISEVFCSYDQNSNLVLAGADMHQKFKTLFPKNGFNLVDFGTRRRFSRKWQEDVVTFLQESPFFVGTSNVYLSKKINKKPVGTMAHEWFQTHQGFYKLEESQTQALLNWDKVYPNGELGVALTDIFNMNVFSKDFSSNSHFSNVYSGLRHDSGDPLEWASKAIKLFLERSNTLEGKSLVFSDGLNIEKALEIQSSLEDENGNLPIKVIFGIGTKLTNNVGAKAPNIVIKNIMTNNKPTVKISDEPGKTICEDQDYINMVKKYIKKEEQKIEKKRRIKP